MLGDPEDNFDHMGNVPAEENDGIAYLMALKRSAVAPTQDSTSSREPASPEAASHVDRRRSPRYKCEGSAEIREMGCDVRTWATFTDISFLGCYVEAQATYPTGTVLQLKLSVNGFKVEATGNVRVSYPYLGMGIAFVDMTEETRAQLRQLLASIAPGSVIMGPGIASSIPAPSSLEGLPPITNPQGALQAVLDFFNDRQLLMREDFLRLIRQSQLTRSR